jgi:hypothetical protein
LGPSLSEAARRALTTPKRKSGASGARIGQMARLRPKPSEFTGLPRAAPRDRTAISEGDMQNCHHQANRTMAFSAIRAPGLADAIAEGAWTCRLIGHDDSAV